MLGTLRVTQALLPALRRERGRGLVINMGSTAGHVVYEGGGGYTAAKHGVAAMTETLRLELLGEPVRFTEIAPGMVATEEFGLVRFERRHRRSRDAVYAGVPEPLTADDVADAVTLGRHPPGPRGHRPARRPSAGPGDAAQGASRLTPQRPVATRS